MVCINLGREALTMEIDEGSYDLCLGIFAYISPKSIGSGKSCSYFLW
jgi:hypothetical protein